MKYIYKISFYESKRHSISHTDMYFEREEDTRWSYHDENSKIFVIRVDEESNEYKSAVQNSDLYREKKIRRTKSI